MPKTQVPVTVLTGYLGTGKTTLLNRVLTEQHGKRYAVIVNEFGEIGIDNELVVNADEEIFEMNNGCICCTVRGDLIRILGGLMKRKDRFDAILVETTGLAYPGPVAQTFFVDEDVRAKTKLDAIVTVVDARHFLHELEHAKEMAEQIAFADVVVVNKTDLVSEDELARVEARIRRINPTARLHRTERCALPLNAVMGHDAFNLERILAVDPDFLDDDHDQAGDHDDHDGDQDEHGDHDDHDRGHAHAHDHEHDEHVQSISLSSDRPLDPERFFPWMQDIVQRFGVDLLRMKGIIAFKDDHQRYVVQAVHMLVEGDHQRAWKAGEKRASRIVLIGRNLPKDVIASGFAKCAA
jgi:G3E family GTPase